MIRYVVATIIGISLAILVSEIILQILDLPPRPVSGWKNCRSKHPGECNAMGFRGREFHYTSDDFVVILVGDSEIYAPHLPFDKMPERRLESVLRKYKKNAKVFTVADMGYGQDQQYLALKDYFEKYRADLVLLMFTERDDVEGNMFPTTGLTNKSKPTFWLEDGELKGPTQRLLEPVGSRLKLALLWQRYIGKTVGEPYLIKWSKEMLPPPYQPLSDYQGEVDYSWHKLWITDPKRAYRYMGIEKEGPTNRFTPRSKRREYGYELTRKLISKIKNLVETHNGQFVIIKEERPWELRDMEMEKAFFLKGKYYKVSMKQHYDNMRKLLEGFEHYRIPLNENIYVTYPGNAHLTLEGIDELFRIAILRISQEKYFISK